MRRSAPGWTGTVPLHPDHQTVATGKRHRNQTTHRCVCVCVLEVIVFSPCWRISVMTSSLHQGDSVSPVQPASHTAGPHKTTSPRPCCRADRPRSERPQKTRTSGTDRGRTLTVQHLQLKSKERWGRGLYLRGDVVGGTTEGTCGVPLKHPLPAHAKVSYLDVSLSVQQDVVQLQVPERHRG